MPQEDLKDYGPIVRRGLLEHLPKLKGAPLAVYLALMLEADPKTFRVAQSVETLAATTGYSPTAVKAALRYLATAKEGYIVNEGSPNPWQATVYFIPKLRLRGPVFNPLQKNGSGSDSDPREKDYSGQHSDPLEGYSGSDSDPLIVGQKVTHGGQHSGQVSGSDSDPLPNIDHIESMKEGMCGSAHARTREGNESSSAYSFLHHLESLTAIWPVPASKYNTPEYASDMAELEACLDLLGTDEARRLTEEAYANSPPENRPKWAWQFKRILQDEIARRKEGNGKARKPARGGGRQAEPEIDRRTREEALAALGNRK